ncbi:alpha/beta hydrolase, partial [candidate division WOR-3 bacterium]|nr:alpha/beta hydrolase [candidate division WOR-3 bacterium]
ATEPNAVAGELCRFVTEDGLELHGFLTEPAESLRRTALVHVHGWDGNFYENRFIYHAARTAVSQGLGFFTFNNRGHDYIADLLRPATGDYVQTGGIYERLSDCRADIRAALGFLRRRSYRRVILQGHSHGAIKVAHFLTRTLEQRVVGLVLLSPSDDLAWGPALIGVGFNRALGRARRLAGAGRDRQLMPAGLLPYPVSAGAFLDSFAPDSVAGMFNLSRTVHRSLPELGLIRVPVLFVVGTTEEAFTIAPEQFVAAAREAMTGTSSFTGRVLEGAPHNYLGHERAVAAVLRRWLAAHRQAWSRP